MIKKKSNNNSLKTESQIQTEAFAWFQNTYPHLRGLLFSVPNGGQRSKTTASRMKFEGLIAGIPDMLFIYYGKVHAFEFKTPDGTLSTEQIHIHYTWHTHGIHVNVIRSADEFRLKVLEILSFSAPASH